MHPLFVVGFSYYNLKSLTINAAVTNNTPKIISDVNGYVIANNNAEKINPIVVINNQPPHRIISIKAIVVTMSLVLIVFDF